MGRDLRVCSCHDSVPAVPNRPAEGEGTPRPAEPLALAGEAPDAFTPAGHVPPVRRAHAFPFSRPITLRVLFCSWLI